MGWRLPEERQWLCVIWQWLRLCNMNATRWGNKIFKWSVMKASLNVQNWACSVLPFLLSHRLKDIMDIESNVGFLRT